MVSIIQLTIGRNHNLKAGYLTGRTCEVDLENEKNKEIGSCSFHHLTQLERDKN